MFNSDVNGSTHIFLLYLFKNNYIFSSANSSSSSWRLWKITGLRCSENWSESGGLAFEVHGILGCQGGCASEPLHEWTLLHPLPHEEQRSAARLHSHSTCWYPKLHSSTVPKYSGEGSIDCADETVMINISKYKLQIQYNCAIRCVIDE